MRWLQQAILRTSAGALRPLWQALYAATARGLARYLTAGDPETAIYLGGSFGFGEPVYGISDVDMVAVSPGNAGAIRERRRRAHAIPVLRRLAPDVFVYDDDELRLAVAAPCLTSSETFLRRDGAHDEAGLTVRPGPFGATREWRLLTGPERRPPRTARDAQSRRIAAWLELQFWWRLAFQAVGNPTAPHVSFLCVKLIAEPVRLWLWLANGREIFSRRDVLREALVQFPEEANAFRLALELERDLPLGPPPPLAAALASLTRQSARLAALLSHAAAEAGTMPVKLVGRPRAPLPLLDWRALVAPAREPESFTLVEGDSADPARLFDLAAGAMNPRPTIRVDGLLVRPTLDVNQAKLRSVQSQATDPVSFALCDGHDIAEFPMLPGCSAHDWARRAVAENRVWLQADEPPSPNGYRWIDPVPPSGEDDLATRDRLLAAARAALFLESLEAGDPTLFLSLDLVAEQLAVDGDIPVLHRAVESLRSYA